MLSAKDIADILGKAQILAATWQVQGGFVFSSAGQTLSVTNTDGIQLRDLYGKAQLRLPIAGPPFLFGETSTAITPKATVHIGDGDFHGLGATGAYNVAKTLDCWQIGVSEIQSTGVAGFFLQQKYKNSGSALGIEAGIVLSHATGLVSLAWAGRFFVNFAGKGGTTTALIGVGSNIYCSGPSSEAYGFSTGITAQSGGTVGTVYGSNVVVVANTSAAIVTAYGQYIAFYNTASTFTTAFGLRILFTGDIVNKWGFYIDDAAAKNYLAGFLGIGDISAINYEKLRVYSALANYSSPAVWIQRSGTSLIVSHANTAYYMSLCMESGGGHPHIVMHGRHALTANVMANDQTGLRGIDIGYAYDGLINNKAGILITGNKSASASAEFTNYHSYLYIGRVLGLPALNSSEMAAQTTRPVGSMIYNTTRSAICVHTGGGTWVTLGTTSYTDTHSDIPHEDTHGDAHTDTHGDAGHSDSHTDTPYSDVTHIDTHGDVAHVDTAHVDTHGDVHYDYTDSDHSDSYFDSYGDTHGDSHADTHGDFHNDYTDGTHSNSYIDVHGDTYLDTHSDTPHTDTHYDHDDDVHTDAHTDTHSDTAHADTAHTDTHADTAHTDVAYVDSHTDSTHTDTHGDTAHEDWHTDHSDAV
jgi:hypothetical protein